MFEDGPYLGALIEARVTETRSGTPQMEMKFDLLGQGGHPTGSVITAYEYLSDAAYDNTLEKLNAIGFNRDFNDPQFDPSKTGRVGLTAKTETWEGKQRQKWQLSYNAPRATNDVIARLNARARASAPAPRPPGAPARPPAAAPARPAPTSAAVETFGPRTVDDAWSEWQAIAKQGEAPDEVGRFWRAIDKIAAQVGKPCEQFGPAEWKRVVDQSPPV